MKLEFDIESKRFADVMKRWLAGTSRELSVAINARMSLLLMRIFALLQPQRVQDKRNQIRAYMDAQLGDRRIDKKTGKQIGKARILKRVHLISQAQARKAGQKGLYGEEMRKASASLKRRAIGSVGYVKSALITAIRRFNGHFTQYGGSKKTKGRLIQINPNMAFMRMMASYGLAGDLGNVAKHKGAKAATYPAKPRIDPTAMAHLSIGLDASQVPKIEAMYQQAATRAMQDERREMEIVIANRLQAAAEEAVNGR